MTPEVIDGGKVQALVQAIPVDLIKVQLADVSGRKIEGYALVDESEIRMINRGAIGTPLAPWAEKAVRQRLQRMKTLASLQKQAQEQVPADLQAEPGDIG